MLPLERMCLCECMEEGMDRAGFFSLLLHANISVIFERKYGYMSRMVREHTELAKVE